MSLTNENSKHPDMPLITMFRLVSQDEGLVLRFTGLGDVDEVVRGMFTDFSAKVDGWSGFLEALVRARYQHDGRATRFHIVAQAVPDEHITWHRERVIECQDILDDDSGLTNTTYCLSALGLEEQDEIGGATVESEHAWSISARLAALILDETITFPAQLIALISEARMLHPDMVPKEKKS